MDIRLPRLGVRGDFKSICRALQLDARQSGGADGDAATWQVSLGCCLPWVGTWVELAELMLKFRS